MSAPGPERTEIKVTRSAVSEERTLVFQTVAQW